GQSLWFLPSSIGEARSMSTPSVRARSSGFTLIELLVVMAIIATLAGLGLYAIPRALRMKDRTVCENHLGAIFGTLREYEDRYKCFPDVSGPAFVLGGWTANIVDHTDKDCEIYFCPSMGR